MSEKIKQSLEGVPRTMLMTLYCRARESQRPDGIIHDEKAIEMVNRIDCNFSQLKMKRHDEVILAVRIKKFDSHVRDFLSRNPAGVVVHIGCGLDTRFERVDNGRVEWFDLDMPEVIDLRQKLLEEESSRYHLIPSSVFDEGWLTEIPRNIPVMFVAEGVLPYFTEDEVRGLFLKFMALFPGCEMVCDAHSAFGVRMNNLHLVFARLKARLHWSVKSGHEPEGWGKGIKMLGGWFYLDDAEPEMKAFRWLWAIPGMATASGIFHYKLGSS